jgi:TRAP-type C4-dicarboxylate transport system permease small subunit
MAELAGWVYLAGALFVTANVISRRYLGFSSPAVVEITGYLLAFGISWGLADTLLGKGHIRVDVAVNKLPLRPRVLMHLLALTFLLAFAGLLALRAYEVVAESWELQASDTTALSVPLVVPQGLWLVGLLVFVVVVIGTLLHGARLLLRARYEELEALVGSRGAAARPDEPEGPMASI